MNIFEFDDYKVFVRARIQAMPSKGRGHFAKLAKALGMHTTLVSQVFKGDRELTMEQACDLGDFWGLNEMEAEMFLCLVQLRRAGTSKLKKMLLNQLTEIRIRSEKFSNRLPQDKKLTPDLQAMFYSNWYYSGIRLLTSIPEYRNVDAIAEKLDLTPNLVARVVDFLVKNGLCVRDEDEIIMGPRRTHLPSDSPLISRHHQNWRMKTLAKIDKITDTELIFTAPLTISHRDSKKVRAAILKFVDDVSGVVKETTPEKLSCLSIEWTDI